MLIFIYNYKRITNNYIIIHNYFQYDEQHSSCIIKSHKTKQINLNICNKTNIICCRSHKLKKLVHPVNFTNVWLIPILL